MTRTTNALVAGVASLLVASCGGGQKSPETPAGETAQAATEAAPTAAEPTWAEMDREERMEYMGLVVLPAMQELFAEYDPEGYKEFKCQTCHGEDMDQVDQKMPNGLYALPVENTLEASKEYDPEITQFMLEKALPKMAELLQMEPGKEFTCMNCHEKEE